jgi:23S rRNA maturation mini-RNase III
MSIKVYNVNEEEYFGDNVYLIHRPYILSNPYTHIKDKQTKAMFVVKTREEAIERYSHYFDVMYGSNIKFTQMVDEIYEKYIRGEDILLGCYCKPKSCHGDIIIKKLQSRLLKKKLSEAKKNKKIFV